ncbi:MAG: FprA family A-type flavoprotein [Holophagales bacterium]|jgi:flavorubredoxin|nr:FprA family A-type flavoprotein [Holophagales bacterium]
MPFRAVKITDDIYWVGALDWGVRDFHGYQTNRGTTYNSFLVLSEKIALIDTVKYEFKDEMMSRIASVIDPSKIDYIISNHAEMDHSGSLPDVIKAVAPEKVFTSKMGAAALAGHFHEGLELTPVEDGGEITLSCTNAPGGPLTLKFIETRFLHWPDSMFSYIPERKFLFSQDAFGMHLASTERFDDQVPDWLLECEAARYFANILLPFSGLILKLLEKLEKSGLEVDIAAPDHGPIWRNSFNIVKNWYHRWSNQELKQKAVVIYDTMWGSTELMANAICEGLSETGVNVKLLPLSVSHRSDVAAEILDAGALIAGSPTLNNQVFPTIADNMTYLRGLKPKPRICATFGSFGWSGESLKHLDEIMAALGFESIGQVKAKYVPDDKVLRECLELGRKAGTRVMDTLK